MLSIAFGFAEVLRLHASAATGAKQSVVLLAAER